MWLPVCVSSVYRVCVGVRHRWTAGVSVVLNHSPLPSVGMHTDTDTHVPSPINHRETPLKAFPVLTPKEHCTLMVHTHANTHTRMYTQQKYLFILTTMTGAKEL